MGPQRVLQAAVAVAFAAIGAATAASADAAPASSSAPLTAPQRERIAVIDLGPTGPAPGAPGASSDDVAHQLQAAIAAAGFSPVTGDGIDDALAGRDVDRDATELATAIATAARAFGALACGEAVPAARKAIGIAAARQAAGRPVPELARAWAYVLLCADRDGQLDAAVSAATQLRALGGSPDVPAAVWAKYPDIDAIADRDLVELDIDTEIPGAAIWVDFRPVGASPVHVELTTGDHVIAAASGSRRGWAAGTAVRSQTSLRVPLDDAGGPWSEVARRVAGWRGKLPAPTELAWLFDKIHARIALIRHGGTVEAWGQVGRSEAPHVLGGDDGTGPVGDAGRVLGVVADRIAAWNAHAPDPDRPLLVEDTGLRGRGDEPPPPTKWWVYAAIGGAVAIGATIILVHDSASDRQRVELHVP